MEEAGKRSGVPPAKMVVGRRSIDAEVSSRLRSLEYILHCLSAMFSALTPQYSSKRLQRRFLRLCTLCGQCSLRLQYRGQIKPHAFLDSLTSMMDFLCPALMRLHSKCLTKLLYNTGNRYTATFLDMSCAA